jgi:hypothetical protein
MKFNQFDNNTSDFFMRITNGGNLVDVEKAIVVLAAIKPSGKVASQFVEVKNGLVYADLKPSMKDEIGTYAAQAMLILEDERVVTDVISYEVEEDKIFSLLNDTVETSEEFTLLTDMLSRLSTIEISEEQRIVNEAERILSEENRKIEEAKRVEAELIRQHEEADRSKYDATRESNENIRKQNESIRLANETNRIDEEAKRVEEENKRKLAEEERNANYNFMTEDEERRRLEANAHKEAEALRVQAETNRVNEEAKRRTTEQARVSAENTRVNNENTRKANETTRQTNEAKRVEAETQRQNRYNSFIADAEANANNFENYTNTAKVKEEERKSNELDRKSQEAKRVSNEVERISNENTRKANEVVREKNEASRQNTFTNKVNEVDKKIVELNTTKDNFVSSINTKVDTKISELNTTKDNFVSSVNTKVDNKISELDNAKSDMTTTVSNKVNEVETRFNALTSSQQQDAEVIDARVDFKGVAFNSLKERIDYTDKLLRNSTVSTVTTESGFTTVEQTTNGYFEDVKLEGKTLVNYISNFNNWSNMGNTTVSEDGASMTINATSWNKGRQISKSLPIGEYIFSINNPNNATIIVQNKTNAKTLLMGNNIDMNIKFSLLEVSEILITCKNTSETGTYVVNNPILTTDKNVNGYFEGLKSVGQSATTSEDGVDEISVESVKGDGNLFDATLDTQTKNGVTFSYDGATGEIVLNGTCTENNTCVMFKYPTKFIEGNTYYLRIFGTTINSPLAHIRVYDDKYVGNNLATTSRGTSIHKSSSTRKMVNTSIRVDSGITFNNFRFKVQLIVNEDRTEYIPHQSDKKRLLYYNEETQTWEKPILREWDSIEKHANAKYYYHQRSAEAVLNGSGMSLADTTQWDETSGTTDYLVVKCANILFGDNFISDKFIKVHSHETFKQFNGECMYSASWGTVFKISKSKLSTQDVAGFKQWLQANNVTAVYKLAEEKVYECTNIDLITYANETNYIVESGVLSPKTTLKVHSNISNVVSLLQKKVSLLESNMTKYMITQNRLMLASRYNADTVSFKVDVASFSDTFEYDNDLYELILNNILVGKDNYNREYIENLIRFYWMDFIISDEMYSTLFEIIKEQHNPKIEEETPLI